MNSFVKKIEEISERFKNELAKTEEDMNELRYQKANLFNKEWFLHSSFLLKKNGIF